MTREIWLVANTKRCPYCNGEIVRSKLGMYHFDCKRCDRAWKIDEEGTWRSLYDASRSVYSKEEIKNMRLS